MRKNTDWKPGFTTFYRLGVQFSQQLIPVSSYSEVGRAMRLSKRDAYTLAVVTLGKVAFQLQAATK